MKQARLSTSAHNTFVQNLCACAGQAGARSGDRRVAADGAVEGARRRARVWRRSAGSLKRNFCCPRVCPALRLHSQNRDRLGHNHSQAVSIVWCYCPRPQWLALTGPRRAPFVGDVGAEASVHAGGAAAEQRGGGAPAVAHRQHALVCSHLPSGVTSAAVCGCVFCDSFQNENARDACGCRR